MAEPPVDSEGGNAVALTVMTFTESLDFTVWTAFPAYMVRTKVSSDLIPMMSEIGATFSLAATRGKAF